MSRRPVSIFLLLAVALSVCAFPHVHANYRINSTALDTWPATFSSGQAVVTSVAVGQASTSGPYVGTNEILAAGTFSNSTNYAQLRIYHKSGNSLVLDDNSLWPLPGSYSYYLSGVQVADVDGSGLNETVTIGNVQMSKSVPVESQIGIWRWTGASLLKEMLYNLTVTGPSAPVETRSLAVWSYAGAHQIVTLGYFNRTGTTSAMLGIWSWDGATFTKNALYNWTTTGSGNHGSQGYAVAVGDVEGNGIPDIVTVGSSSNGTVTQSELKVFGWTGSGSPLLKLTRTWVTTGQDSAASSVSLQDFLGNGKKEIVVGGQIFSYPFVKAEVSVWQYVTSPSASLNMLAETNWQTSSQTSVDLLRVATGDLDNSGTAEIVTAGFFDQPVGATDVFYGVVRTWTWSGSSITLQQAYQYPTPQTALYGVAVADIDKVGKQDLIVGGQQVLKGFVEIRDAAFVYGTLSLNFNPSPVQTGQSATVSGTLTNATDQTPLSSAQVLLEYSNSSGVFQILATVNTDSSGRFGTSFTTSTPGSYTIRATWSGDNSHMGTSITKSLTANKVPSIIVLSSSTSNAQVGDTIAVTGYVYPATSNPITLIYSSPGVTSTNHTVTSDGTGAFTDQFTVNSAGTWTITASWSGSAMTAGAKSNSLTVQSAQPQPQPIGVTLSLYGFIIAVAAAAIGVLNLIRKSTVKTPNTSTSKPA